MTRKMEELGHGTEEMSQYTVTLKNGKQVRLFVSADDWETENKFMVDCMTGSDCHVTRYSVETVTIE